jgi:hypothetical protein
MGSGAWFRTRMNVGVVYRVYFKFAQMLTFNLLQNNTGSIICKDLNNGGGKWDVSCL